MKLQYTGDFRFENVDLSTLAALHDSEGQVLNLDEMYLDTTFCSPNYKHFPSREESLTEIWRLVTEWIKKNGKYRAQKKKYVILFQLPGNNLKKFCFSLHLNIFEIFCRLFERCFLQRKRTGSQPYFQIHYHFFLKFKHKDPMKRISVNLFFHLRTSFRQPIKIDQILQERVNLSRDLFYSKVDFPLLKLKIYFFLSLIIEYLAS